MEISAPKVLKLLADRIVTDQLWLMYRYEWLNGDPIDLRSWGLAMVASSDQGVGPETAPLPVSIVGADHDYLQLLVPKPASVLTIGPLGATNAQTFVLRQYRAGEVGQVSLTYTYLTIRQRPTFAEGDETYDTGSIYPESFVVRVDPATLEIVDFIGDPGAPSAGAIRYFVVQSLTEANTLASGSRKFIEIEPTGRLYLYRPAFGLNEVTLI
ncbi:hypothetical protein GCM10028803_00410 [Larkinella knui]|uniref:Uncharacterized protein n=1 Tax=Larkinella knui TaxID=2025310 RepID=A0A3P1CK64_9BACT|nr:hypothetical protein [Larkinella knui]RRB13446.1 hypothetical protein EHT87_14310 [Larkinella knui]